MTVREATRADVPAIVAIFHNTIHKVNVRDYSAEQVQAWSPVQPDADSWAAKRLNTRITFVAEEGDTITGFGELERNGHIDCFYCHHCYQRRGVGSAVYRAIENRAKALGLQRLFVEASITARLFFEAMGFEVTKEQTVTRKGIQLTNFLMEKQMGGQAGAAGDVVVAPRRP